LQQLTPASDSRGDVTLLASILKLTYVAQDRASLYHMN
jgi:hypothetical protein